MSSKEQFAYLTNRAGTSRNIGDGMGCGFHLGAGVRGRDGKSSTAHDHDIGQVVTNVSNLAGSHFRVSQNLLKQRDLLNVSLKNVRHAYLTSSFGGSGRVAAANHTGLEVVPRQPSQGYSVLRIESFRLDHVVLTVGNEIKAAVGEDAVDIHQENLHLCGELKDVLFRERRFDLHGRAVSDLQHTMRVLPDNLLERIAEIFSRHSMLSPGDRVGAAVSGGADSVALLHVLWKLSERCKITPVVLHYNHQLRGAESEADEQFVRELANFLGIEALFESGGVQGGNVEEEARIARRAFFARVVATGGVQKVALGHTRSDQAETVLFRFVRGSGTSGLSGMRFVSMGYLLRPLLTTSRTELREWAKAEGISWRDDSSNENLRLSRNWIRKRLIPELETRLNPSLERVLAGTADVSQAEEDYWTEQVETIYEQAAERGRFGIILEVRWLQAQPLAVQRRLVRRVLAGVRGNLRSIDFEHIQAILAMAGSVQGHDRILVPGCDVMRSFAKLRFRKPSSPTEEKRHYREMVEPGRLCKLPFCAGYVCLERATQAASICANFKGEQAVAGNFNTEIADIDEDALPERPSLRPLFVRNWEPGDDMQRAGHRTAEKVKSLFQEFRVLLWERKHWPVMVSGEEIVWVRKFGSASKFAASAGSRRVLRIAYRETEE